MKNKNMKISKENWQFMKSMHPPRILYGRKGTLSEKFKRNPDKIECPHCKSVYETHLFIKNLISHNMGLYEAKCSDCKAEFFIRVKNFYELDLNTYIEILTDI